MVDRTHGGASNADLPLAQALFPIFQEYYPEILDAAYIAPVNRVFWSIWFAAKLFIDKKYTDKVRVLSGDDYRARLAAAFPAEALPAHLGGARPAAAGYPALLEEEGAAAAGAAPVAA